MHELVSQWWAARLRPNACFVPAMRMELTEAVIAELRIKISLNRSYDPFSDARVLWGAQYLHRVENSGFHINPDIKAQAAWLFNPPLALCGKDRAAGAAYPPLQQ